MDIIHRVTFRSHHHQNIEETLEKMGIPYMLSVRNDGNHVVSAAVYESNPHWPEIKNVLGQKYFEGHFRFNTVFSEEEIRAAEWSRLIVRVEYGYPQPENQWGNGQALNQAGYCSRCGIFSRQISPYFMKKEPKLKKWDFFMMYWVPPIFAKNHVFEAFARSHLRDYERQEVLLYRTRQPAEHVAQLVTPYTANPGYLGKQASRVIQCEECGQTKYLQGTEKNMMQVRRDAFNKEFDFLESHEWFGTEGRYAFKELFVSNRVAQIILDNKFKGLQLKVVELV
ncbi:MAG: hypothetical protein DHS20C20_33690 [Ardenticatenaceae bacterium]|nr:MAG: hypothetical protein DHS20C20_33690 [Ardenticatenaceae bacterium]